MIREYAGIGARASPPAILDHMRGMGHALGAAGYQLRSGGARGADGAFEEGHRSASPRSPLIFRASDAHEHAINLASMFHSKWSACDDGVRRLHGRNAMILLGDRLNCPVDFVLCWTEDGRDKGGTGLGMRIALAYDIPIINLNHNGEYGTIRAWEFVRSRKSIAR